jgi:hypothetical protein
MEARTSWRRRGALRLAHDLGETACPGVGIGPHPRGVVGRWCAAALAVYEMEDRLLLCEWAPTCESRALLAIGPRGRCHLSL